MEGVCESSVLIPGVLPSEFGERPDGTRGPFLSACFLRDNGSFRTSEESCLGASNLRERSIFIIRTLCHVVLFLKNHLSTILCEVLFAVVWR